MIHDLNVDNIFESGTMIKKNHFYFFFRFSNYVYESKFWEDDCLFNCNFPI